MTETLDRQRRVRPFYRGKIQTAPKCPVRTLDDFAVWYTPGVAASSRAIAADPELVYSHTNKARHHCPIVISSHRSDARARRVIRKESSPWPLCPCCRR